MEYIVFSQLIKPPPPPIGLTQGYAKVLLYDQVNDTYFDGTIYLYDYNNESYIGSTLSNTIIYLNDTTVAYANLTGYHQKAQVLGGLQTGYYNNIISLSRKAFNSTMSFGIVNIDGNTSLTSIDNLTDGNHIITFQVNNTNTITNFEAWGMECWLPNGTYLDKPYTITYNISGISSWIGWKGNISNVYIQPQGYPVWIGSPIYDVATCNTTWNVQIYDTLTFKVSATFYNIIEIYLYEGFIDDFGVNYLNITRS